MSRTARKPAILILLLAIAVVVTWFASKEFRAIDACLDSGGSFEYPARSCDHVVNHPAGKETDDPEP